MYLFWFNGKDNGVYVSKIIRKQKMFGSYMQVKIDPEGGIQYRQGTKEYKYTMNKVPIEEGKISYRRFWLSELDYEKAENIINDYYKDKAIYYANKTIPFLEQIYHDMEEEKFFIPLKFK